MALFSFRFLVLSPVAAVLLADHPVSPTVGFDVVAYTVSLTPTVSSGAVRGTEMIELRAVAPNLRRLSFSPNELTIRHAELDGHAVRLESSDDALSFVPSLPLEQGKTATLTFDFDGRPRRGVETVPAGIYTSYYACDWMVCLQDSPGDKARLTLDLTVPAGMISIAPGRQISTLLLPNGEKVVRWRAERAFSPYLYGFAVGRFARVNVLDGGRRFTYIDATGNKTELAQLFAETPAIAAFVSEKAGVPLPDGHYEQILVPGYEAQEAATFSLIGEKALARDLAQPDSEWIIVHELSHQIWGNSVTCATWRDFWLNEGFATFMTAAWKEQRYGRAAYDAELDVARSRLAKARAAGFDKPLTWDGAYPSIGARRAVQYSKGALFLDALRREMGDRAFWAGIKGYTEAHVGSIVTSADFQRDMQRATRRDLSPTFDRWVY